MPGVVRLETYAELEAERPRSATQPPRTPVKHGWAPFPGNLPSEAATDDAELRVSLRLEAVLDDGRRVLLLDDRGWTQSGPIYASSDGNATPPADLPVMTREDIEATARVVIGPDEPFESRTHEDMEADHWAWLVTILEQHGVTATPNELRNLPHNIVLSPGLEALTAHTPGSP